MSRSARIRTLCGGFGNRLLSQEHAPSQGVRGESNPPPRPSQGPMQSRYTTDTISSPGRIRTCDFSHVTGTSCPLNDGTVRVPRPGFEPGTPRSKRGMMVRFTIGASSGRQGSRTLISLGRTALAERPGQPYPATFQRVPRGVWRGASKIKNQFPRPSRVRGVGIEPTVSSFQGWRNTAFLPPEVDREGVAPSFPACGAGALLLDQQPSDPGWTRTIVAWMSARSLCRWTTGSLQ